MAQGYVYVLKNPTLKENYFKIGKTTRTVKERIKEISQPTGVAKPYEEAYSVLFNDCDSTEKQIHKILAVYRQGKDREFFEVDLWIVIRELTNLKIAELQLYFKENLDKKDNEIANLQKELTVSKQNLDKKDREIVKLEAKFILQTKSIAIKQKLSEIDVPFNVPLSIFERVRTLVMTLKYIGKTSVSDNKIIEQVEKLLNILELDFTDNQIVERIERLLRILELSHKDNSIIKRTEKLLMRFRDDLGNFLQILFSNSDNIIKNILIYLSKNYAKDGLRAKTLTTESIYKNISSIIATDLSTTFNETLYQKLKSRYNISVFEWQDDVKEHKKFYFRTIIGICLNMNFIKGFAGGERRFLLTKDGFNALNTKIEHNYEIEDIMILYLESFQRNNSNEDESKNYY